MKQLFLLIAILFLKIFVIGQDTNSTVTNNTQIPSTYSRNAMTVLVLKTNNNYGNDLVAASGNAIISSKFDDNNVETGFINAMPNVQSIQQELTKKKVASQIISKWFMRDTASGKLNMTIIHERGMYNATDDEIIKASATKIGLANLKDAGESLINRSYIMVLEFYNIETMRQVYNKREIKKKAGAEIMNKNYQPVRRVKNGWVGNVRGYLYRLNFNDSVMSVFYDQLWIYDDDDEETQKAKKAKFDEIAFPMEFVAQVMGSADGSQYNANHPMAPPTQHTRVQLFQKMINTGLSSCLFKTEKILESFRVKAPVYKTHPISAKVGKKEGLKTDHRYFVMETYQNSKGNTVSKRKAVVRVKKAIDNNKVATGKSTDFTTFYQTAGQRVDAGMVLHQRNDFGTGLSGGISIGEIGGGWAKLEQNVALLIPGNADIGITQLKIFGSIGYENKNYNVLNEGTNYDLTFLRWQAGISKGFYFARRFSLAPFIAFGSESGSNSQMNSDFGWNSNDFIGADFFNYGINGSINILHFLQVYASVNMYSFFGYTYSKQKHPWDIGKYNNKKYTDFFNNRKGLSFDIGGRIEF